MVSQVDKMRSLVECKMTSNTANKTRVGGGWVKVRSVYSVATKRRAWVPATVFQKLHVSPVT